MPPHDTARRPGAAPACWRSWPLAGGAAAAQPRRRRRCATPSRSPRTASTRRRSPTCTRARVVAQHLRRAADLRLPGAAGASCGPTPPRRCPRSAPTTRSFIFRIRPGIFFADDPAFKGQQRELMAADYVYSIKRHYDPRWKQPDLFHYENARHRWACRSCARRRSPTRQPFDYDTPVEGLRALDRYTFRSALARAGAALPLLLRRRRR